MKIFISHSLKDPVLIRGLQDTLVPHGLKLFIAEHHQDLERTITQKIESMIRQCDAALILLTKNGYNSHFVQQEIGYIKSQNKPFLQIIQVGYEKRIKGFNYGNGFVSFDPLQPQKALETVKNSLLRYWQKKKDEENRRILAKKQELEMQQREEFLRKLRIHSKQQETAMKFALGALATFVIIGIVGATAK